MGEAAEVDLEEWRRDFDAVIARDWDRAQRIIGEEVEWHDPPGIPDAHVHRGRAELRAFWESVVEAVEEWWVKPEEFIRGEDDILVRARMKLKGRHTGMKLDSEHWQVFTFEDGVIVRQRGFFERDQALEAFDGALEGGA